ncbi:cysteine desulfurase family protein [Frankia casuarinae]|uniref:cysteine desulfurase n=2 Tax=Frankia casuarinae (strain DSM 45818 / CECT 9043 / HFP020203 / CcI3) TaxID=106370 RepID=Q2J4H1_FRACC|nr:MULTISPECIES: cysteine desulfurase family protein [Frankia]ABD13821.1 aminotransferase, class V [Frankia casuarinae]ETA04034.1 cysteine desulfurase family protein [Frankia sp. CcI6]EYT94280.1 cysteine desulfurase family protein [Frankia casuarinae]KDA44199.1 cysteine desulfurase family protein [Frankia sp. BMG5.23]KFB06932.1 cysteine desulfurase family protein [Frankia sp. Allo2]
MIYLDHNATTPVDPEVVRAMLPLLRDHFANPASSHPAGQAVARLVEGARRDVANLAGAQPRDVIFTSGATEAANLAIAGVLATAPPSCRRVLVGATEHRAVLAAAEAAARVHGAIVQTIRVHPDGTIDLNHLRALLQPVWDGSAVAGNGGVLGASVSKVALVAVMTANNETGTLNDPRPIAELAHGAGAFYLADITQTLGRMPVSVADAGIDLALASAHKLYGPKGTGALIAGRHARSQLAPLIHGGGQERGLRAGTVNTAGVVGFGAAARIAAAVMDDEAPRQRAQTELLHDLLVEWLGVDAVELNGPSERGGSRECRLPNTINLRFVGADADAVQACLPDVAVSAGSACHGGGAEPSHVLTAMGRSTTAAMESLRFSVGRFTSVDQIHAAAAAVARAVLRVRALEQNRSNDLFDGPTTEFRAQEIPTDRVFSRALRMPEVPAPRSAYP